MERLTNQLLFTELTRDKLSMTWKSLGLTFILKEVSEGGRDAEVKEKEGGDGVHGDGRMRKI